MKIVTILMALLLLAHPMAEASSVKQKKSGKKSTQTQTQPASAEPARTEAPMTEAPQADGANTPPAGAAPTEAAPAVSIKDRAVMCIACHGENGNSTVPTNPILAGQNSRYLYLQLKDFKEGRRKDPLMSPMAATLSKDDMRGLADHFAAQKAKGNGFTPDPAKAAKGKAIADAALCTMCHLGGLAGQNEIPRVGGQHYEYVVKQLKDFRAKNRTNDAGNMTSVSRGLSDEDIENLAHYVSGLN